MPKTEKLMYSVLSCVLSVNLLIGFVVYAGENDPEQDRVALSKLRIMMRVLELIRQDYVDAEKVDYESLLYSAMEGMVSSLDAHSSFMRPELYEEIQENTEGEFDGIGIYVTTEDGVLTVISPIEGTPAYEAGISAGDRIIEVDGHSTQNMELEQVISLLKGEAGTEVELKVYTPSTDETQTLTLSRETVEVPSVRRAQMLDDQIGYLRLVQFDANTTELLGRALADLKEQGMQSLVIDLRNNPGGLLRAAQEVTSYFLPKDELVVYTQGRLESQHEKFFTTNGDKYLDIPIVILVNGGSASASEIVSGCLRDHDRAVLIGETTFGKGTVQSIIALPEDCALRLTTARYYTPSGVVIHERGVEPDIKVVLEKSEWRRIYRRLSSVRGDKNIAYSLDPQLNRAVELLNGYKLFSLPSETPAMDEGNKN